MKGEGKEGGGKGERRREEGGRKREEEGGRKREEGGGRKREEEGGRGREKGLPGALSKLACLLFKVEPNTLCRVWKTS